MLRAWEEAIRMCNRRWVGFVCCILVFLVFCFYLLCSNIYEWKWDGCAMTVPQLSEHSGSADWKISPSPPPLLTILLPLLYLSLKIPFNFFNYFKPGICSFKSPEIQAEHLTKQTGKVQWRHLSASQYQTPQPSRYFLIPIPSFVPKTQKRKILIFIQHFLTRIPWWILSDWLFFSATSEIEHVMGWNVLCIQMMHCSSQQTLSLGSMVQFGSEVWVLGEQKAIES